MVWKDLSGQDEDPYEYQEGFGNHFSCTHPSAPHALPTIGNNPLHPPYGLYTEQLSGTSFTSPRHLNSRTWLYRIRPSVCHTSFVPHPHPNPYLLSSFTNLSDPRLLPTPTQLRWDPFPSEADHNWIDSWRTIAGAGETQLKNGLAIHWYGFGKDMQHEAFYNSDGDVLMLPVSGVLDVKTEFGRLWVPPGEICVVPRGVKVSVSRGRVQNGSGAEAKEEKRVCTGYVLETFSAAHFTLPELGPIGANGLANPRDFRYPVPYYEDIDYPITPSSPSSSPEPIPHFTLINKFLGTLHLAHQTHSPYNTIAYHGTYLPYKYPLSLFSPVGSISHDHPDPSIFTVLTCPSPSLPPGTALADVVLFSPRWLCAENTFRPPYFHRNVMTEFMVNVRGKYDAKDERFMSGGASLHSMNVAHGPDRGTWEKEMGRVAEGGRDKGGGDAPVKIGEGCLAVMFESGMQLVTTRWAVEGCGKRQVGYNAIWEGFEAAWRREKPEGA